MPDKFEREIDEILRKSSFSAPRGNQRSPGWLSGIVPGWQRQLADLSPSRLLTYGLVLAVLAYFLREFAPEFGVLLSLAAVGLLLLGLVLSISQRNSHRATGWRGRSFDASYQSADIWEGFKRRWQNWRRGRGWTDSNWR